MYKFISLLIIVILLYGTWFVYDEIYRETAQPVDVLSFEVKKDEDVTAMTTRLADEQVVRNAFLFRRYLIFKHIDTKIHAGTFRVDAPITIARVAQALKNVSAEERNITIIPGWDIRDIASYFEREGIATADEVMVLLGETAMDYRQHRDVPQPSDIFSYGILKSKPWYVSLEGYLSPDTFRVYKDASLEDILEKFIAHRDEQFSQEMYDEIKKQGRSVHEIVTMASILEREVRGEEDKKKVSDLFWRRYDRNWALQADSTVHYAVNKSGNVFTTAEDRETLSPWNTYKYPGLPIGPISNPSYESIIATIYPTANDYWYFLTDDIGRVHFGRTLEEHNANVNRYLR